MPSPGPDGCVSMRSRGVTEVRTGVRWEHHEGYPGVAKGSAARDATGDALGARRCPGAVAVVWPPACPGAGWRGRWWLRQPLVAPPCICARAGPAPSPEFRQASADPASTDPPTPSDRKIRPRPPVTGSIAWRPSHSDPHAKPQLEAPMWRYRPVAGMIFGRSRSAEPLLRCANRRDPRVAS